MKIAFIINPVAGTGNYKKIASTIKNYMKSTEIEYKIYKTSFPSNAKELAVTAIESGATTVVAVGGDGTANEVANGVIGKNVNLGIIASGSGNDFAKISNLPLDLNECLKNITEGKTRTIDTLEVNGVKFLNIASIGMDADTVRHAEKYKKIFKDSAYVPGLIQSILTFKSHFMNIEIDGQVIEGRYMLAAIANGNQYGGKFKIAPDAKIDDGLIDICLVGKMSKLKMLVMFPNAFVGKHIKFKEVTILRATRDVKIKCDREFTLNIDGNIFQRKDELHFRILPNSLNIICNGDTEI